MSGRHLRRGLGSRVRRLVPVLAVLLVGLGVGAGGSLLLEARDEASAPGGDGAGSATMAPEPGPITIALVGDITVGAALGARLEADPDGFVGPLAGVLRDADLAIANLDAAVAEDPAAVEGGAAAPPDIIDALVAGGIDVVSLANDRSLGAGSDPLEQAMAADDGRGVVVGLGADEIEAYAPARREVGGHTVAVIAATQLLEPSRIASDTAGPTQPGVASAKRVDRLVAEVESARGVADTVIVYVHWGTAGETCPGPGQQELASALVAAGADVVAGPGAGRLQGAGRAGGAAVAYGLGSFLVEEPVSEESGVLLVEVDGREVLGLEWVPARIADGVPRGLAGVHAGAAVADWTARRACTGLAP